MQYKGVCKTCGSAMAVVDILLESYDLVCIRCGMREVVDHSAIEPRPCYQ